MPRKNDPSYRYHKARDCAVVTIAGDHYLGEHDSDASWEEHHHLVADYPARLRQPPPPVPTDAPGAL